MNIDPAVVLALAHIASNLSGYALPTTPPPTVMELTTKEFRDALCPTDSTPDHSCNMAVGWYRDGDLIWIDGEYFHQSPKSNSENSFIVHELVHWLQAQHGWGGSYPCSHSAAREHEAYRIQNKYVEKYDHKRGEFDENELYCR